MGRGGISTVGGILGAGVLALCFAFPTFGLIVLGVIAFGFFAMLLSLVIYTCPFWDDE